MGSHCLATTNGQQLLWSSVASCHFMMECPQAPSYTRRTLVPVISSLLPQQFLILLPQFSLDLETGDGEVLFGTENTLILENSIKTTVLF